MYPLKFTLGALLNVIDDLHYPVIMYVADCFIAVAGNLVVQLCDWCWNGVRVQVPSRWCMLEADDISIFQESNWIVRVVFRLIPSRKNNPVVVVILVVVACHLLLIGSDRICLDVRM